MIITLAPVVGIVTGDAILLKYGPNFCFEIDGCGKRSEGRGRKKGEKSCGGFHKIGGEGVDVG